MTNTKKISLAKISLFQALGLTTYCSIVGISLAYGNQWFGKVPQFLAPLTFLLLFTTSALICGLITLSYPGILFLRQKQPILALKLIFYTILWLVLFTAIIISGNLFLKF